ncbi:MAG TPA: GAF domain-containing protein, partial [Ktedonobacterales bacterium]|nr:GAF domain-containing protein [Ktedonobacterales bacterium]
MTDLRGLMHGWLKSGRAGTFVLVVGMAVLTLLIATVDRTVAPLPNPGTLYLPLIAMLAYHWGWRLALIGAGLELFCVYYFFLPPLYTLKPLTPLQTAQLAVLAFGTGFVLALVQLARSRRGLAEREAGRFAALNRIGASLASELDEARLLRLIAATARDLTGAEFAAFTLRPVNEIGRPVVPAEGNLFRLAAVVGVTPEQEALLQRISLGGEGLLAPIFRHGMSVRVADALALATSSVHSAAASPAHSGIESARETARRAALNYAHGLQSQEELHYVGIPRGHPVVRSFLGAPLLDTDGQVRGGLLLGHSQPDQFGEEDESLLVGLAAQAAVALENVRLYRGARVQAQELDATFESIADGIALVTAEGEVLHENAAAQRLRVALEHAEGSAATNGLLGAAAARALLGGDRNSLAVSIPADNGAPREYLVSAAPLQSQDQTRHPDPTSAIATPPSLSAVVVFHDVTEANRLIAEQHARAEAESRLALLQLVVEELPSGVYLVRGRDARLVLANRAAADVWGASWPSGQAMSEFLITSGTRIFAADGHLLAAEELGTLQAVRTGTAIRHYQETIRHPNGTTLPILMNVVALQSGALAFDSGDAEAGGTSGPSLEPAALVVLQDLTALNESERLKDDFIGIAAHELRNPMAALKGFAQMLTVQTARGHGPALAEWQQEAVRAIDQATARLIE